MSHLAKILSMNDATVEYVYEDENGQQYTNHELLEEVKHNPEEVMIIEHQEDIQKHIADDTLGHDENLDRDPDCRRKGKSHEETVRNSVKSSISFNTKV